MADKKGLYDNIHAKQERIKAGSGERNYPCWALEHT